jgi:hypothetical protein
MNILGSFGNLYMAVLLILLVVGVFYTIYYLIKKIHENFTSKLGGDSIMKTNGWLKLAIFSFVGLIISVVLLNLTNPTNAETDQHSTHVNGTAAVNGTVQGTVSGGVTMDQMNSMMEQMNQLQQQMMQMQQQMMGGMSQGSNMGSMGSSGGMGSMGGSGSMGGMGGMGGMMNMNSGSSGGSSSGGGMGMM